MKKYIAALIALFLLGVILSVLAIQQNRLLDDNVYLGTTASIRNLKLLDNTINITLFNKRYENKLAYADLEESVTNLSEEFDNLRYEALLEEIESSDELESAAIELEEQILNKDEYVAEFIEYYRLSQESKKSMEGIVQQIALSGLFENVSLLDEATKIPKGLTDNKVRWFPFTFESSRVEYYKHEVERTEQSKTDLMSSLEKLKELSEEYSDDNRSMINEYVNKISKTIQDEEKVKEYFLLSLNRETGEKINAFEEAYVNYHNFAIEKANRLRNALIIYGLVLLGFLTFLAFLLRKQYQILEQKVVERTNEIQAAYTDLKESQEQLIQSEKMASLGEMVAGVAHEINTPLGYVNSNITTVSSNLIDVNEVINKLDLVYSEALIKNRDNKKISSLLKSTLKSYSELKEYEVLDESAQLLGDAEHGLSEISELVVSLKDFSRLDRKSVAEVNVHDCIDNAVKIATNIIRENNVSVEKQFGELPLIVCMPSKLNQLFLNIITNATQAMSGRDGTLTIQTAHQDEQVVLVFSDEGIGMDVETSKKMFDPFFTSKPIGEGTGLGMSIAYKIVQDHKGEITVDSSPDEGTTITIHLPVSSL